MSSLPPVRNLRRWREVQAILLRYGFDMLIDQHEIALVRRFLHDKLGLPLGEFSDRSLPERARLMLQELGPTYVKLGQIMSSRSDLLPAPWISELTKLQDAVPSFPYKQVRQVIEKDLGRPPKALFADFEPGPMAAASIGQVHRARLHDQSQVVVKVQRPGIQPQVQADVAIIREIARLVQARTDWGRSYGVSGVADEFARSLISEMDYRNEARNADRLRKNLAAYPKVHVPHVYWSLITPRVLTMERVQGVRIDDIEALEKAQIDRDDLAEVLIRSICQQLLLDGFFHADPHPGNLWVNLDSGTLIYLDMGMMGRLVEEQRKDLGDLALAIQHCDSREVVRVVLNIGQTCKPVQKLRLQREIDQLLDRYMNVALYEISFAKLVNEILTVVFEQGIRLPQELTLAIKTLVQAEAIARTLNPDIEVINIAKTVAQQLIWQRLTPSVLLERFSHGLYEGLRLTRELPKTIEQLLSQMQSGTLRIDLDTPELRSQAHHLHLIANRITAGVVIAGLAIGSAIAMSVSPSDSWTLIPILGIISFVLSVLAGMLLIWRALLDVWRSPQNKDIK